jgi:putative endonuclease
MTRAPRRQRRVFQRCYFVYLLANLRGNLYTGLTDDLRKRIMQHKDGTFDGFTKKYTINRLMYFETHTDPRAAANRELQIKKFRREKKIALFRESNPQWKDLTGEIFAASFGDPSHPASGHRNVTSEKAFDVQDLYSPVELEP